MILKKLEQMVNQFVFSDILMNRRFHFLKEALDLSMLYSWVITGFKETLSAGEDPKIAAYLTVRYHNLDFRKK